MEKHNPQRTCIICRESFDKEKLFRLVEGQDGVEVDYEQKAQKRGKYICKSLKCIERLSKHKKIKVSMKDLSEMAVSVKKKKVPTATLR